MGFFSEISNSDQTKIDVFLIFCVRHTSISALLLSALNRPLAGATCAFEYDFPLRFTPAQHYHPQDQTPNFMKKQSNVPKIKRNLLKGVCKVCSPPFSLVSAHLGLRALKLSITCQNHPNFKILISKPKN